MHIIGVKSSTLKIVVGSTSALPSTILSRNQQADPAVSGRSILDAIHDTEAFVAANDDMMVVVFRGTHELTDWTTNLNMGLRSAREEWKIDLEGCDLHRASLLGVISVGTEKMLPMASMSNPVPLPHHMSPQNRKQ